ncbi:MAG: hypothetical protein NVSMB1_25480 [Polyangiales bacterium]
MKGKLFLVQWDVTTANQRAAALRREGWHVETESENGGRAYRRIRTSVPDMIILDLAKSPTQGRELGGALRDLRATRVLPVVCIEENCEGRELTRDKIPDAIFTMPNDIGSTLDGVATERLRVDRASTPSPRRRRAALPLTDGHERT